MTTTAGVRVSTLRVVVMHRVEKSSGKKWQWGIRKSAG
jgi:hypothetical protein